VQIDGTELTESGQRSRSNRNFRLGSRLCENVGWVRILMD
jgi:hypothetical protein